MKKTLTLIIIAIGIFVTFILMMRSETKLVEGYENTDDVPPFEAYIPMESPPDPRYEYVREVNAYLLPYKYLDMDLEFHRWMYYNFPIYYSQYYGYNKTAQTKPYTMTRTNSKLAGMINTIEVDSNNYPTASSGFAGGKNSLPVSGRKSVGAYRQIEYFGNIEDSGPGSYTDVPEYVDEMDSYLCTNSPMKSMCHNGMHSGEDKGAQTSEPSDKARFDEVNKYNMGATRANGLGNIGRELGYVTGLAQREKDYAQY